MSFFCSKFAHKFVCMTKLSIITINRNNAAGLRKTMESVFAQTYRDFEYIVVDGASDDGSVEVVKEFEQKINPSLQGEELCSIEGPVDVHRTNKGVGFFTWISEPDTGIYNAMNKGVEIALGKRVVDAFNRSTLCGDKNKEINRSELVEDKHGEADQPKQSGVENKGNADGYVLMLNSGDYLVDEHVIERIIPELDGTDIVQGNIIKVETEEEIVCRGYGRSEITFIDVMKNHFLHQASFCRRDLFERYGYYDESYKINGDTVFYAKCLGFGDASFRYIDINIAFFDIAGISADPEGKWIVLRKEEDERYAQMFSKRMWDLFYKEEKKINLYDKLHAHCWSWNLTMAIAHLCNWIYKAK